ncbi:MAG: hypothetical protein ABI068_14290 [Ktedonobacterales bacterium]
MAREREQVDEQFNQHVIEDEAIPDERPTQVNRNLSPQTSQTSQTSSVLNGTGAQPVVVPVVAPVPAPVATPMNASAAHDAPTYADPPDFHDDASTADNVGATNGAPRNAVQPASQPPQAPYVSLANAGPAPHHKAEAPNPEAAPQAADARYTHVGWEAATSWGTSSLNGANTAAGLSYLFWWVSGLIVYFNERHNRYVRFHAVQSILWTGMLTIVSVVLYIAYQIVGDIATAAHQPWVAHVFQPLVILGYLGVIGLWIWPMVAAWNGHYLGIPILGEYAERYAAPPREPYPGPPPF